MPEKKTVQKAREKKRKGYSPSTQAGEFVHEEIRHVRQGKHGARSTKQLIAIGLSKARKAGVAIPSKGKKKTVKHHKVSARRSKATLKALKKEPHSAASHSSLSRHAHKVSKKH